MHYISQDVKKEFIDKMNEKEPIYKGCDAAKNGGCFCTGACKQIIGYRNKYPNKNFPQRFPCSDEMPE